MKEVYSKLNYYLNEICKYLEKKNSFLLDNIDNICRLNDTFLNFIRDYDLDNETIQNNLNYEEVYALGREIIESIDKNYLKSYDNLLQSGELDFSYDNAYDDSECLTMFKGEELLRQLININREFNYNDVVSLIHEFIHYVNGKRRTINRNYLTEFLSIYFELYAIDYLLKKGINKEEIDYLDRIKNVKAHSRIFCKYEIILLAYEKFGNLDEDTINLLHQFFLNIEKEVFEKECVSLHNNLCDIEEKNKYIIEDNPDMIGYVLAREFFAYNYKYILGTFLSIYACKYSEFKDIVWLNNHINELEYMTIFEICLSIGIDLNDDFSKKLFVSFDEYLKKMSCKGRNI